MRLTDRGSEGGGGMGKGIATLGQPAAAVQADPVLAARAKDDPAPALAGPGAPLQTDVWIYRIVVGALAILSAVGGAIVLAMNGRADPRDPSGPRLRGRGRAGRFRGPQPGRRRRMKRRHELQAGSKSGG